MSSLLIRRIYMFVAVAIVTAIGFSIPALVQSSSAGNGKVVVCHIPPGNSVNFQEITVSENALPAHLAHGDILGQCELCPGPEPPDECPCDFYLVPPTTTCWDKAFYASQSYELLFPNFTFGSGQLSAQTDLPPPSAQLH